MCQLLTSRWLKKAVGRAPVDGDILAGHARSELRLLAKASRPRIIPTSEPAGASGVQSQQ